MDNEYNRNLSREKNFLKYYKIKSNTTISNESLLGSLELNKWSVITISLPLTFTTIVLGCLCYLRSKKKKLRKCRFTVKKNYSSKKKDLSRLENILKMKPVLSSLMTVSTIPEKKSVKKKIKKKSKKQKKPTDCLIDSDPSMF